MLDIGLDESPLFVLFHGEVSLQGDERNDTYKGVHLSLSNGEIPGRLGLEHQPMEACDQSISSWTCCLDWDTVDLSLTWSDLVQQPVQVIQVQMITAEEQSCSGSAREAALP